MSDNLLSKLKNRLGHYLDVRVIFVIDVFVSFVASAIVLMAADLMSLFNSAADNFYIWWLLTMLCASAGIFALIRTHRIIIRHSNLKDLFKIAIAVLGKIGAATVVLLLAGFGRGQHLGILLFIDFLLTFFMLVAVRILMVVIYDTFLNRSRKGTNMQNVLVYGAGNKAAAIVTRLVTSQHFRIVGFVTTDKTVAGKQLYEFKIYGCTDKESFAAVAEKVNATALLFPVDDDLRGEGGKMVKMAIDCGLKVLVAPSIDETHRLQPIREVRIEDLLGREEIQISMNLIRENFHNKVVMVTGAAGSIGSELCHQLAGFGVRQLVLFDNGETPMHELRLDLEETCPALNFVPVIGDVRQKERLDFVFRKYHPQVVFHAAAYKHVPLMEENPCEAVLVNVDGTRNVADKCIEYVAEKMVMISTDKAVNPTNVMGCSKRLAEIYVQSLGTALAEGRMKGKTRFVTTRFGNVLGSHGSVIPRFREQIAKGGPVTVTHPDITRFFMTIPEACRLVMEAATMSRGNEIFIFDMGQSVKIDSLARRMIELAGLTPDEDIKIVYSGLRPGEKLYEEVLADTENTLPTSHERIRIAKVREYDYEDALKGVNELRELARAVTIEQMVSLMKRIVPEFKSKNSVFEALDKE
ncbi:MAG: polysaccharide biosynthesis protein [Bacteroidales bacterium]|nr:polysaccharide biosynthesis protein [Bacteroidales bacterium]